MTVSKSIILGNEVFSGNILRTENGPLGPGDPYGGTCNEDYIFFQPKTA